MSQKRSMTIEFLVGLGWVVGQPIAVALQLGLISGALGLFTYFVGGSGSSAGPFHLSNSAWSAFRSGFVYLALFGFILGALKAYALALDLDGAAPRLLYTALAAGIVGGRTTLLFGIENGAMPGGIVGLGGFVIGAVAGVIIGQCLRSAAPQG